LYQIEQFEEKIGTPWPQVLDAYLSAWQLQPDRAQPLYRIGLHYQIRREYFLAHLLFSRAMLTLSGDRPPVCGI
jgi:hypothetical protein